MMLASRPTSEKMNGSGDRRSRRSINRPLASSGRDFISLAVLRSHSERRTKGIAIDTAAHAAARAPGRKAGAFCSPLLKVDADAAINMTPV